MLDLPSDYGDAKGCCRSCVDMALSAERYTVVLLRETGCWVAGFKPPVGGGSLGHPYGLEVVW
jgi:hypothetical protein